MGRQFQGPEPSNWELFRDLESFKAETLFATRSIHDRMNKNMVSRDLYLAEKESQDARINTLYEERRDTLAFRRSVVIAVSIIVATTIANLILAVVHLH